LKSQQKTQEEAKNSYGKDVQVNVNASNKVEDKRREREKARLEEKKEFDAPLWEKPKCPSYCTNFTATHFAQTIAE